MKARGISNRATPVLASLLLVALAGCGEQATVPASAGFGPHPLLPPPHPTRIPTMNFARQHVDGRVQPPRPELVASAFAPDYALGAHTASLGLTFYEGDTLPGKYAGGAFIGQHSSWNRKPRSGYKVIFVPFADGHPAGPPEDVLTDFLNADGQARGRPVGVAVDHAGALLVADDVGGVVWRVTRRTP